VLENSALDGIIAPTDEYLSVGCSQLSRSPHRFAIPLCCDRFPSVKTHVFFYFVRSNDAPCLTPSTTNSVPSANNRTINFAVAPAASDPLPVCPRRLLSEQAANAETMLVPKNDVCSASATGVAGSNDDRSQAATVDARSMRYHPSSTAATATKDTFSKYGHSRSCENDERKKHLLPKRIRSPIDLRFPFLGRNTPKGRDSKSPPFGRQSDAKSKTSLTSQKIAESIVFRSSASASPEDVATPPSTGTGARFHLERQQRVFSCADDAEAVVISAADDRLTAAALKDDDDGNNETAKIDEDHRRESQMTDDVDGRRHSSMPVRRSLSQGQNDSSGSGGLQTAASTSMATSYCRSVSPSVWNRTMFGRSASINHGCGLSPSSPCAGGVRSMSSFLLGAPVDPP
jgi:hypothetical protein